MLLDKVVEERTSAGGRGRIFVALVLAAGLVVGFRALAFDSFGMNHQAEVCNGYTFFHLPK